MSDTLDFATLIPPRLKINNLPDGTSMELLRRQEMGAQDFANFADIQARVDELNQKLKGKGMKPQGRAAIAVKLDEELGLVLKFLSPGLTDETLTTIKTGQRMEIMQWWAKQHQESSPNGSGDQTKESYI